MAGVIRNTYFIRNLHRWSFFQNGKYLNCSQRIERCHSMNYEDYSFCKKEKGGKRIKYKTIEKDKQPQKEYIDYFNNEDITTYMLTIG